MPFTAATIPITPFKVSHSEQEISDLKTLLRLSPLSVDTYENQPSHDHKYGPSKEWMLDMISSWQDFDWASAQGKINGYPQFMADVPDTCPKTGKRGSFKVHFVGIENEDPRAIPVVILHGWPGNFWEILPLVDELLKKKGGPPMHLIVPRCVTESRLIWTWLTMSLSLEPDLELTFKPVACSLIGYSYSSPAPLDRELGTEGVARIMNTLMTSLGYDKYVVQGGDLGAFLGRIMAIRHEACQAVHCESESRTVSRV